MAPILPFRESKNTEPTVTADLGDRALCPGCHTADPTITMTAVMAGALWTCTRCAQRWDADKLAAVAGYAAWVASPAGAVYA
jgi:hypothetical protein